LLNPDISAYGYPQEEDQISRTSAHDSPFVLLTEQQQAVVSQILESGTRDNHQFLFLQGSAGTRKTFKVKALFAAPQSPGKKCLICGATGIAAVQ
jgi:RecG-like helicase